MKRAAGVGCNVVVVVFLALMLGALFVIEVPIVLGLGWIAFLGRTLPAVTVNPGGLATGALFALGFGVAAHRWLGWLRGAVAPEGSRWPARWTAALVGGFVLTFVVAIAAAGIAHQVGWLVSGRDPVLQSTWDDHRARGRRDDLCRQVLQGAGEGPRTWIRRAWTSGRVADLSDSYRVLLVEDLDGGTALVVPRDPGEMGRHGFTRCGVETGQASLAAEELEPMLIAALAR